MSTVDSCSEFDAVVCGGGYLISEGAKYFWIIPIIPVKIRPECFSIRGGPHQSVADRKIECSGKGPVSFRMTCSTGMAFVLLGQCTYLSLGCLESQDNPLGMEYSETKLRLTCRKEGMTQKY